jgi:hypothetical protein
MAVAKPDPNQPLLDKYTALGLTDVESYVTKGRFDENKAKSDVISKVYKLDPATYTSKGVVNLDAATTKYQFEQPKLTAPPTKPTSFTKAVSNFSDILRTSQTVGVDNLNKTDQATIKAAARAVRDFDSKTLGEGAKQVITNITEAADAIDSLNSQRKTVEIQNFRSRGLDVDGVTKIRLSGKEREAARGRLVTEQDTLRRLQDTLVNTAPKLEESLTRFGLSDIAAGVGRTPETLGRIDTGLEALRGDRVFQTGNLLGRLGSQVTDDQILNDINTARKNEYKSLYDLGTAATTDLQSQVSQANQFLADLPPTDPRRADVQKTVDSLTSQLSEAQKDTLEAKNLFENYQPVSGEQATGAITQFRESLRLPEQRTLDQIREIDPQAFETIKGLGQQFQQLATTPLGPTTTQQTEDLRNTIEQEALNQLRLGSTIGEEERRGYEQSIRAAQTARGNIFGLGPAVQEASQIGAAGEQRKLARYGAASAFLGSGETTGAATARDLGLRNALEQSRLGAAASFAAGGPTMYNMASQRLGTQQGMLNNYLAASQPQQTGGFQATPSAANPYAYVNPNAGFIGAQNAASIYNTLADYQASTYGAKVGAEASMYRSPFQNFASAAGGASSLFSAAFPKGF